MPAPPNVETLRAPAAFRAVTEAIVAVTDGVCERQLDTEYGELCRRVVGRLARKRPSPLARGDARVWAAGVIYTVGSLNFLFDCSQEPHTTADELAAGVGVVKRTMANKSARIRKILELGCFEPELMRRSLLQEHPLTWLIEVNGLLVDARRLPAELQDEARRRGLIPDLDQPRAA